MCLDDATVNVQELSGSFSGCGLFPYENAARAWSNKLKSNPSASPNCRFPWALKVAMCAIPMSVDRSQPTAHHRQSAMNN